MSLNLDKVNTSPQTKLLYVELLNLGVDVKLELYTGYFTLDLAIPSKKINIEVDGSQHQWDYQTAVSDFARTFYAMQSGYFTLRIPNVLVDTDVKKTAKMIKKFIDHRPI